MESGPGEPGMGMSQGWLRTGGGGAGGKGGCCLKVWVDMRRAVRSEQLQKAAAEWLNWGPDWRGLGSSHWSFAGTEPLK